MKVAVGIGPIMTWWVTLLTFPRSSTSVSLTSYVPSLANVCDTTAGPPAAKALPPSPKSQATLEMPLLLVLAVGSNDSGEAACAEPGALNCAVSVPDDGFSSQLTSPLLHSLWV